MDRETLESIKAYWTIGRINALKQTGSWCVKAGQDLQRLIDALDKPKRKAKADE